MAEITTGNQQARAVRRVVIHEASDPPLDRLACWSNVRNSINIDNTDSAKLALRKCNTQPFNQCSICLIFTKFGFKHLMTGAGTDLIHPQGRVRGIELTIETSLKPDTDPPPAELDKSVYFDYVMLTKNRKWSIRRSANKGTATDAKRLEIPKQNAPTKEITLGSLNNDWRTNLTGEDVKKSNFGVIVRLCSHHPIPMTRKVTSLIYQVNMNLKIDQ